MSDPLDRRSAGTGALLLGMAAAGALALSACQPLSPAQPPPENPASVPCTLDTAVATDTVAVVAGACNPGCIRVRAGMLVGLVNQDAYYYLFAGEPPSTIEVALPAGAWGYTPPLPAGTTVLADVHWPAATVTIFAE